MAVRAAKSFRVANSFNKALSSLVKLIHTHTPLQA